MTELYHRRANIAIFPRLRQSLTWEMLRERPFTSGRSLQRHDRTRSNQMGGTLYAIPPQTPIYRTRSPGYRETLYKIVNLVRDHSFCTPSHPYESGAFNGPEAKNSRSQVRPAAFRFAVREGFEPPVRCRTPVFEAGSFNHSDISPGERDCKYSN